MSVPSLDRACAKVAGGNDGPLKVLILDDMETDRMRLRRLCRRAGLTFYPSEVDTLVAFSRALEEETFDIAFLDYQLGVETGLDALDLLKRHPDQDQTVAIMVSSMSDLNIAVEAMRRGCADYINKEELTVEAIRKSLALAFERRLLVASLGEAVAAEREIRRFVTRLARTCGTEIKAVVAAALEQVRNTHGSLSDESTVNLEASLSRLERLCVTLSSYLEELGADGAKAPGLAGPRPQPVGGPE